MKKTNKPRKINQMTKKEYCEALDEFKAIEDDINGVHEAMKKLSPDFGGFYIDRHRTLIVKLLENSVGDKDEWTSYFIYELDWGKGSTMGGVKDQYGKKWKLDKAEKVYDLINLK